MTESEICLACHGCCNYVTVGLDFPRSKDQKDSYSWYLSHRNVEIYIDNDNDWNLLFKTPCNHLQPGGVCGIYEKRFEICRDYEADSCSRTGKDHKILFKTADEMMRYLQRRSKKKTTKKAAKKTKKKK